MAVISGYCREQDEAIAVESHVNCKTGHLVSENANRAFLVDRGYPGALQMDIVISGSRSSRPVQHLDNYMYS
ncbi:hypothetical protein N7510_004484 [Penicillium lagena]|uniref:uncharacterized protein n=1 Tax=Penicillium lagena TaxID=94218 RepID=UPI002540BD68|nr:uncharacterized protein N7510_004484 [Penicillium lagena]KAJ5620500.1 hypothetical protein N7510_004484 [Penicillium lagena]